jgi:tetratricopeptide (TPR) repeat protein
VTPAAPPPPVASTPPPVAAAPAPPPVPATVATLAKGAILFDDLGTYARSVTASADAKPFFDQGLRLTYAFNHDEAARSFAHAAELDPSCALCYWGAALTLGPNYNVPMLPDRAQTAWDALDRARTLASGATPVEQALIGALAKRYKGPEPLDPPSMQPFNVAYAAAMHDVAVHFPDDDDVQVLAAEAGMDTMPWKLWSLDGKPAPGTDEIVSALERVLARNANHPGANHYLIHAVEASPHPDKALPSAERLAGLVPGAGHIVHMSAHIFQRVGRYADASAANSKAVDVDLAYMKKTKPPGYYPMYLGHNYGFLAFSASMEGRSKDSLAAARNAAKYMPASMADMMPGMDFFSAELGAGQNTAKDVFGLAHKILEARLATLEKKKGSLDLWKEAALRADKLAYSEPDDWFYSVRHYYGAALLSAGKGAEAEPVYREDLRRHPHNGWALFGVWKSLEAQKDKKGEVAAAKEEFETAWKGADVTLKSSAF